MRGTIWRRLVLGAVLCGTATFAMAEEFEAKLSGAQEVVFDGDGNFVPGGTDTSAEGFVRISFNGRFSRAFVNLRVDGLVGTFAAAHFHCGRAGQNGPVVFGLINPGSLEFDGNRIAGRLANEDYSGADCEAVVGRPVNNLVSLAAAMEDGLIYANVHSNVFPPGEVRGQLAENDDD